MKKLYYFIIAAYFASTVPAGAQIISTVAGNPTAVSIGDGGAATLASIQGPFGVTVDHVGNIYIADQYNNRVRKVSTSGTIATIAGTGVAGYSGDNAAATAARLNNPSAVAVDAAGNIFVSDMLNNVVRKINTAGIITTYAGVISTGNFGGDGNPATASTVFLHTPMGLSVDASGNLYIAELDNDIIRMVSSAGIISTVAGVPNLGGYSGDAGAATDARLNQPSDVKIDAAGNLYIADNSNNVIRKVDASGTINTCIGSGTPGFSGDGGQATMANLYRPSGIALGNAGEIFVSDWKNQRIREVYPSGVIYTLGGTGAVGYTGDGGIAHYATMNYPYSGSVDTGGNFYFADYGNNAIRKITPFHNHTPAFASGHSTTFNVCINSTNDTVVSGLSVNDLDTNQVVNWFVITSALHGTAASTATATTTGGTISGLGVTYTPATGYTGTDVFKLVATDGIGYDTMTVNINVQPVLTTPVITGKDSVCPGNTDTLLASYPSGTWASGNTTLATISSSGIVTAISRGLDTIVFTATNACGSVFGIKSVFVRSHDTCLLQTQEALVGNTGLLIYPNPGAGKFNCIFSSNAQTPVHLVITDLVGNVVKETQALTNREFEFNLEVPSGMYFYTANDGEQRYSGRLQVIK